MKNNTLGSTIFNTSVVKTDEALMLIKSGIDNGATLEIANDDMLMIDAMLYLTRLQIVLKGSINKTRAGYLKKNSNLYCAFSDIINGRLIK
jgi:hypothetical protein